MASPIGALQIDRGCGPIEREKRHNMHLGCICAAGATERSRPARLQPDHRRRVDPRHEVLQSLPVEHKLRRDGHAEPLYVNEPSRLEDLDVRLRAPCGKRRYKQSQIAGKNANVAIAIMCLAECLAVAECLAMRGEIACAQMKTSDSNSSWMIHVTELPSGSNPAYNIEEPR